MYSLAQVYGEKPFQSSYLPTCMYTLAPYYADEQPTGPSDSATLPTMASILPLPLLPTDIDVNDANIKNTLEDVLSRQMLLLCRLNQLEQQLLQQHAKVATVAKTVAAALSVESPKIALTPGTVEDIVIHFNLDAVPYSLFALITALRKNFPVLTNLHLHSSVAGQPVILRRLTELKSRLARTLSFAFSASSEFLTRASYPLIVTFVVNSTVTGQPRATFQATQSLVQGELLIARSLLALLEPESVASQAIWSLLTNPSVLASDKAILKQLGPRVFNLSDHQYLLGSSQPSQLDIVLWSLTVPEFTRPPGTIAASFRTSQLLNSKWQAAIGQFLATN